MLLSSISFHFPIYVKLFRVPPTPPGSNSHTHTHHDSFDLHLNSLSSSAVLGPKRDIKEKRKTKHWNRQIRVARGCHWCYIVLDNGSVRVRERECVRRVNKSCSNNVVVPVNKSRQLAR